MVCKRSLALLLTIIMVISIFPGNIAFAEDEKASRRVYLHAQGMNPEIKDIEENTSVVYFDETAEIYYAIDQPNKGDVDKDGNREEPWYDLNGYTVKIYFDPEYLEFTDEVTDETNARPFEIDIPNSYGSNMDGEAGQGNEQLPDGGSVGGVAQSAGYYDYEHKGYRNEDEGLAYAYLTVFFNGGYIFNDKKEDGTEVWENLCMLPLKPRKTGNTDIWIEVYSDDKHTAELIGKNKQDDDKNAQIFDLAAVNGGRHTLTIKDRPKPQAPVAVPPAGTYPMGSEVTTQGVKLKYDEGCEVYYTVNGDNPKVSGQLYDPNIGILPEGIKNTTTIKCYAKRIIDQKESDVAAFEYIITPKRPTLFTDEQQAINEPTYAETQYGYYVYTTDNEEFCDISDGCEIYYTFNTEIDAPTGEFEPSKNPEDAANNWVEVFKSDALKQKIGPINEKTVIRLITVKGQSNEEPLYSGESRYTLLVRPADVVIRPESGTYDDPVEVKLRTDTEGAKIYYTRDGRNPIQYGVEYDEEIPIILTDDTTIYAVAELDGQYSKLTSAWYIFDYYDDNGIKAYYPQGVYEGSVNVTLTPNNPELRIRYKLTGDDEWKWYDDPKNPDLEGGAFVFDKDVIISAQAVDPDLSPDANADDVFGAEGVHEFKYIVKPKPPVFSPDSTQYTNQSTILITAPEWDEKNPERYELWYNINGGEFVKADGDSVVVPIDDYKTVSAYIVRNDGNDTTRKSDVVTHAYDFVRFKPVQPIATLSPRAEDYIREIGDYIGYFTEFAPVTGTTGIYYTIAYNGDFCPDPVPNTKDTIPYTDGDKIELKGKTTIKAVAQNIYGVSDVAVYTYTVSPEAPYPAPSGNALSDKLPLVPVRVLAIEDDGDGKARNIVKYTLTDGENTVTNEFVNEYPTDELGDNPSHADRAAENAEYTTIWIDTATGLAYRDENGRNPVGENLNQADFTGTAKLEIWSELDGVESARAYAEYRHNLNSLSAPFADVKQGTYEEKDIDGNENMLVVKLDSLNDEDKIYYTDDPEKADEWNLYTEPIKIPAKGTGFSKTYYFYSEKDGSRSKTATVTYLFVPLAPVITLPSGRYSSQCETSLKFDNIEPDVYPEDKMSDYIIEFRQSDKYSVLGTTTGREIGIDKTKFITAYVRNKATGKISDKITHYYVIESSEEATGSVGLEEPFDAKPTLDLDNPKPKRIAAHELAKGDYADGIGMFPTDTTVADAEVHYKYRYRIEEDKTWVELYDDQKYDPADPIMPTEKWDKLIIDACLYDKDEEKGKILGSDTWFFFDFVHLDVPLTTLEEPENSKEEYDKGDKFRVLNRYTTDSDFDKNVIVYYTLEGSDPVTSSTRVSFRGTPAGREEELKKTTTVKTVYYSACGVCDNCKTNIELCSNHVYGEVETYKYPVKTKTSLGGGSGGGGGISPSGGGGVIDKTRRYTVDVFGYEHPTHVGYINGYPDGSVQADGQITREEATAILYRIKNHDYEKPFIVTGNVFPDVEVNRWSVKEVEYMAEQKVVEGYPDGEFKPARNLTRAEFAALICRFINLEETGGTNRFPDVDETHWAYNYILSLDRAKIITGYEDGTFRPENRITRAEVMTIVNKILGRNPHEAYVKSLEFNPFTDLDENKWYYVTVLEATITHNYWLTDDDFENPWEDWK